MSSKPSARIGFVGIESAAAGTALEKCLKAAGHSLIWSISAGQDMNAGPEAGGTPGRYTDPDIIIAPQAAYRRIPDWGFGPQVLLIGLKNDNGGGIGYLWGDDVWDAFLPCRPVPGVYMQAVEIARKRREDGKCGRDDRRALEKIRNRLETGEQERAALLEIIPAAVYFKNTELEYVTANKTFSEWTGIPLKNIAGKTDHDFFPWDLAEKFRLDDTEVILKGEIKSNIDETIISPEGVTRWVSTSKTPFRGPGGKILGMAGISIDITPRKRMENVLRELTDCVLGFTPDCNENIRSLLSLCLRLLGADFGVYLRNSKESCRTLFTSGEHEYSDRYAGFCRTLDTWSRQEEYTDLLYIPDLKKIPEELGPNSRSFLSGYYSAFLGRRIEIGPAESAFLGCFFSKPYTLSDMDSRVVHLVASAAGIEEQRRLSEEQVQHERNRAEAASRAKSEFLAHMSHEFKTPLNGILGYAQILKNGTENREQFEHGMEVIERGAHHLSRLIEDILDLSKIEAGKLEVRLSQTVLKEFLQDLSSLFQPGIEEKGLRFFLEIGKEVPYALRTDERRLRQVLLNLLGNAVKYTENGSVTLAVDTCGDRIRFSVEDTGAGIPPDELESVFSPFVQLKQPGKTAEGTGLGLYISKKIVEELGGTLRPESVPEEGSRFWFELPLTENGTDGEEDTDINTIRSSVSRRSPDRGAQSVKRGTHHAPPQQRGKRKPAPREYLRQLYYLASMGDIGEVRFTVDRLLEQGILEEEFAQSLLKLCGRYNIEKLKQFIIEYLE